METQLTCVTAPVIPAWRWLRAVFVNFSYGWNQIAVTALKYSQVFQSGIGLGRTAS
jgi:hypothetical protein